MGVLALTLRLALLLDLESEGRKLMVSKIFSTSIFLWLNAFLTPPPKPFIHLHVVWQQIYMGVYWVLGKNPIIECCWERNEFDKHLPTCYGQVCPGPLSSGGCKPTLRSSFRKSDGTGVAWGSSAWDPPFHFTSNRSSPILPSVTRALCFLNSPPGSPTFSELVHSRAVVWQVRTRAT